MRWEAGAMNVSVMVARSFVTSPGVGGQGPMETREIKLAPFMLDPRKLERLLRWREGPE